MRDILRAFTGSIATVVSAKTMAIEIEEIQPPLVGDITDDFHGGGMPGPVAIPLGVQLTDASFKTTSWNADIIRRAGLAEGQRDVITFRGAAVNETDGQAKPIVMTIDGRLSEADVDAWSRGSRSGVGWTISTITFYKLSINDKIIHEIDFLNMRRYVNGVD